MAEKSERWDSEQVTQLGVGWHRNRGNKDRICRSRSMVPDGSVVACPCRHRRRQGAKSPTANDHSACA
jgi:hypothetical protein